MQAFTSDQMGNIVGFNVCECFGYLRVGHCEVGEGTKHFSKRGADRTPVCKAICIRVTPRCGGCNKPLTLLSHSLFLAARMRIFLLIKFLNSAWCSAQNSYA
jgi:hypothetical protein